MQRKWASETRVSSESVKILWTCNYKDTQNDSSNKDDKMRKIATSVALLLGDIRKIIGIFILVYHPVKAI